MWPLFPPHQPHPNPWWTTNNVDNTANTITAAIAIPFSATANRNDHHTRAKERVMQLVDSEHKDVQRHALQCVSKIMVNKWEFIR